MKYLAVYLCGMLAFVGYTLIRIYGMGNPADLAWTSFRVMATWFTGGFAIIAGLLFLIDFTKKRSAQ